MLIPFPPVAGWLFTEGDALSAIQSFDPDSFSFDMQSIVAEFPSLGLNVSEFLAPGREWLNSKATNFQVGRGSLCGVGWVALAGR